jgi:hypothetical protein
MQAPKNAPIPVYFQAQNAIFEPILARFAHKWRTFCAPPTHAIDPYNEQRKGRGIFARY